MKHSNKTAGDEGETLAALFLEKAGYKILERNYRCLYGEIDIIALKKKEVVFAEIKRRSGSAFGAGYEAVDRKKQEKIIKTAQIYINEKKISAPCRFDVISIDNGAINHIENAFSL